MLTVLTQQQSTFTRRDQARLVNRHTADADQFAAAMALVDAGERGTGELPLLRELQATARQLRQATVQRHRLDTEKARTDMRDWAKARRERTRHLIELGGLVQKAGLVELLRDDRATLLGAFLHLADQLHGAEDAGDDHHHIMTRWRRRGLRAFDADHESGTVGGQPVGQEEGTASP